MAVLIKIDHIALYMNRRSSRENSPWKDVSKLAQEPEVELECSIID
jgi:hypothetical protein